MELQPYNNFVGINDNRPVVFRNVWCENFDGELYGGIS